MWRGKLLGSGSDAKTVKGNGEKYNTAIVYIKPWKHRGKNVCPMAELAGCHEGCLNMAGRGKFSNVQAARERKAQWFAEDREWFMMMLAEDIRKFSNYCRKKKIQPVIRLNGTSDIQYEKIRLWSGRKHLRSL